MCPWCPTNMRSSLVILDACQMVGDRQGSWKWTQTLFLVATRKRPVSSCQSEAEPEIEHLFVSDVTPESFRLAWTAEDDVFDRFVLKVRDSRKLSHPRELIVPGDERTKVLTQLLGGTEYEIELYGVTLEHRSQPVTAVARTGIVFSVIGLPFASFLDLRGLSWLQCGGSVFNN